MALDPPKSDRRILMGVALAAAALLLVGGLVLMLSLGTETGGSEAGATGANARNAASSALELDSAIGAARQYLQQQQPGRAEAILRAAYPKYGSSQELLLIYGETLLTLERTAEAYEMYDRAISIGPDHAEYRFAAGMVAEKAGLLDQAEAHLRAGQHLDKTNPKFPLMLAQILRSLGRNDEARASLVLVTRLNPDLALAWASLASIAIDENRLNVARQYISKARAIEPERVDWRVVEAMILRRQNQPGEAATLLMALDEQTKLGNPAVVRELSMSLGLLGRPSDAAALYEAASEANPENAEVAYEAAVWLERVGRPERAARFAQRAVTLGSDPARQLLAKLDGRD